MDKYITTYYMSTISDLLNVNLASKVPLHIYVNSINSIKPFMFINSGKSITETPFSPTAESLLSSTFSLKLDQDTVFNLPSSASVFSYLSSRYGISSPLPNGFSFTFKIVNLQPSKTIEIHSNSDSGWDLSYSVASTGINMITQSPDSTRNYTCVAVGSLMRVLG